MANRSILHIPVLLCLPMVSSACSALAPSENSLPPGAIQISPPAAYLEWHAKTERCSGRTVDFSTFKFYVVPGVETFSTNDGPKVGSWTGERGSNRILIAGMYQDHEMVVRHELLHALLRAEGHPAEYFVNRCRLTWESWNGSPETVALGSGD